MSNKIIIWSITVALAGFLFGFDTVVISGAEQALQKMWGSYELFGSNDNFHGYVVVGSALFGTIFGALLGGFPTNIIGRKNTLIWIGVLYTISAIGSGLADNPWVFGAFRFLGFYHCSTGLYFRNCFTTKQRKISSYLSIQYCFWDSGSLYFKLFD